MKGMRKFFADGGGYDRLSLSYYSPDVDARWTIDNDGDDGLQIVYHRKSTGETYNPETSKGEVKPDENFWLYLTPHDAAVIGSLLTAYAAAHGEEA